MENDINSCSVTGEVAVILAGQNEIGHTDYGKPFGKPLFLSYT